MTNLQIGNGLPDEKNNSSTYQEKSEAELYARTRSHVLTKIDAAVVGGEPFAHIFIDGIFPVDFYNAFRSHMLGFKHGDKVQDRHQDNPAFINKRYSLVENNDEVVRCIRGIFSEPEVKHALLKKFYVDPNQNLAEALQIHSEFEYTFTEGGMAQNIHVDIPPKFMSFVFYVPEHPSSSTEEKLNATILYDKALVPHYPARFKSNSLCIFVPHFYSYHGFSSTIDRDVLVMFYIDPAYLVQWHQVRQAGKDEAAPFTGLLDEIERKLRAHPLREFEGSAQRILAERAVCRVNAPKGRVLLKDPLK